MKLPELPPGYYLDHFLEMMSFVEETYEAVLDDNHRSFLERFRNLTPDEKMLFVRLFNRRGRIFNLDHLQYDEITDVPAAVIGLRLKGYLSNLEEGDYAVWLTVLTKAILLLLGNEAGFSERIRASWTKARLIEFIVQAIPFATASRIIDSGAFVVLKRAKPLQFLLYLYFGKTRRDLKSFALRDLGLVRVNDAKSFQARFTDVTEANACFFWSQLLDSLTVPEVKKAAQKFIEGPLNGGDYASALRGRAAFAIGRIYERNREVERAIQVYRSVSSPECNERLVRLLFSSGQRDEAKGILERIIDDPGTDDEHSFASDFYARKFGGERVGASTGLLRSGRTVIVDEIHRGRPEMGAASVFRRDGGKVYFAENILWRNLFGLLFWDELFQSGQLHSGFDWVPQCLKDRRFAKLFETQIERKLESVCRGTALSFVLKAMASYWGKPNGILSWGDIDPNALRDLLNCTDRNAVAEILRLMAQDYPAMRDGFPDLMICKGTTVRFIEIKAAGDAIRRNQLTRLRQLQAAGFSAEIFRADYKFDPEQDYVVVDIETTGGMSGGDRITEIGALKVRNHQVIDQWHTLINPQRRIPESIIRLTRITNEMVRSAPVFAEIADTLKTFMGDSIFVAHNVNFDYGFIRQEFARLERHFRFPKFCTCAGMRRYYPGHRSYSLGSLCGIYQISLEQHHRALCDAVAASKLLNIINRKRESQQLNQK